MRFIVEKELSDCPTCGSENGHGLWTVVWTENGELHQLHTSYGDEELAEDICQYMNDAYSVGWRKSKREFNAGNEEIGT